MEIHWLWQWTIRATQRILTKSKAYSTIDNSRLVEDHSSFGVPQQSHSIGWLDWVTLCIAWTLGIVAMVSVFDVDVAASLGQTRQLIVVGFLISIMTICMQGRSLRLLVAMEVLHGETTLQNLEAILAMSFLERRMGVKLRSAIFLLVVLPLSLSVAYKSFSGGTSSTTIAGKSITFGMTPPPQVENVGWGLSLFSATMLPFWSRPQYHQAYGYSLWIQDAEQVALLDSPLEGDMQGLQASLKDGQFAQITAVVSAVQVDMVLQWDNTTVADLSSADLIKYMGYSTSSRPKNNTAILEDYFNGTDRMIASIYSDYHTAGIAMGSANWGNWGRDNNTFFVTSRSNLNRPSTAYSRTDIGIFIDNGQGFVVSLKPYTGTWNVTKNTARLLDAHLLSDATHIEDTAYNADEVYASVFQRTYYAFAQLYLQMLVEFDWKFPWARFDNTTHLQGDPNLPTVPKSNITTDTVFVAAMVWSRITTKWGPTSPENVVSAYNGKPTTKYAVTVEIQLYTETLRRHPGLAIVILLLPVLTTAVFLMKWLPMLRGAPVSNGFGLVSMLAAIDEKSLPLLKGATYSGDLSTRVFANFSAYSVKGVANVPAKTSEQIVSVRLAAHQKARSHTLDMKLQRGAT